MSFALAFVLLAVSVPVPGSGPDTITDRKGFIPVNKQQPLPGKLVGVLVPGAQPVLSVEGRSGPEDQLCLGYNGCSYRWVYVPVTERPMMPWLDLPVASGERKRFNSLSLAMPATVQPLGVGPGYSLVEVEVNAGLGSPADQSFAATKMKTLDGTTDYPLKVADVMADLQKRYARFLTDQSKEIDAAMAESGRKAIGERKPTGPRERSDLTFVTWLPEAQRLRVHFRTHILDGEYKYANGIRIDLGPTANRPGPLPNGLRYGTQFGVELGMAYEVSKAGKLERTLTLTIEGFQKELPPPPVFNGPVKGR